MTTTNCAQAPWTFPWTWGSARAAVGLLKTGPGGGPGTTAAARTDSTADTVLRRKQWPGRVAPRRWGGSNFGNYILAKHAAMSPSIKLCPCLRNA
jgi:hypothetical protein